MSSGGKRERAKLHESSLCSVQNCFLVAKTPCVLCKRGYCMEHSHECHSCKRRYCVNHGDYLDVGVSECIYCPRCDKKHIPAQDQLSLFDLLDSLYAGSDVAREYVRTKRRRYRDFCGGMRQPN